MITYHPGNQDVSIELLDASGTVLAAGQDGNGRKLSVADLPAGDYRYRVTGQSLSSNVDFVVKSRQETR